jgi:hypothetical protein
MSNIAARNVKKLTGRYIKYVSIVSETNVIFRLLDFVKPVCKADGKLREAHLTNADDRKYGEILSEWFVFFLGLYLSFNHSLTCLC